MFDKSEDKWERRARILYPTMKDKENPKEIIKDKLVEALAPRIKQLSREDILYPTMKSKKEEDNFSGGAADIGRNNNEKSQQIKLIDDDEVIRIKNIPNEQNSGVKATNKKVHVPDTKKMLEIVGLNNKDYEIKDNTITTKTKPKKDKDEYHEIDPKYSDAHEARKITSQELSKDNEKYLENNAKLEQYAVDNINNPITKFGVKLCGKEAAENLHMSKTDSFLDTDYARKHQVLNNYKEMPKELQDYFKKKIPQQVGADKLDTMKGIFYDEKSEPSKNLKHNLLKDKNFIRKLNKYTKAMDLKMSVNDSIALTGANWSHAVGNADIRDMHINKNGDLELYIADVYDFNEGEKSKAVRVGRNRQEKGEITPYFYAYRVIIPSAEMKSALKNQKDKE